MSLNVTPDEALAAWREGGNINAAARLLGVSRGTVRLRLEKALAARGQSDVLPPINRKPRTAAVTPPPDIDVPDVDPDADGNWRAKSACLTEDPELFFPIGTTGPAALQIAEAKAVCAACPVTGTCLRWSLDHREEAGVWGGLTEDERRALIRREARSRARHATPAEQEASA